MSYLPAESDTGMFGGNSNWRGPIWMPVNGLIIRALLQYYAYYGDSFTVECPTGSGPMMTLYQVAEEISRRLGTSSCETTRTDRAGLRRHPKFQEDPHWRDLMLFYEYFHGDNGAGLGASHQTGWRGGGQAAADLAQQLFVVLDARLQTSIRRLSDAPEGSRANPLRPNQEVVGAIESGAETRKSWSSGSSVARAARSGCSPRDAESGSHAV